MYGVASVSRIDKIIGLFCRISSLLWGSFAKETYNLKEPTHRSHPILWLHGAFQCLTWLIHMLDLIRSYLKKNWHHDTHAYALCTHTHTHSLSLSLSLLHTHSLSISFSRIYKLNSHFSESDAVSPLYLLRHTRAHNLCEKLQGTWCFTCVTWLIHLNKKAGNGCCDGTRERIYGAFVWVTWFIRVT